jgi:hypothetical protein
MRRAVFWWALIIGSVGIISTKAARADHDGNVRADHSAHGPHLSNRESVLLVLPWGPLPYFWTGSYTPVFLPFAPVGGFVPGNIGAAAPVAGVVAPLGPQLPGPSSADRHAPGKSKPRASNVGTKARAGKFVGYGDMNFGKQKYLPAVERYKTAAQIAPDVAEVYFRQAYALVALGKYGEAVKAFRRGLGIRSQWHDSTFRLNQLYGDGQVAKISHLENLAKVVETNPLDADLLVVLGIELFFDGQHERSELFFARAAQLGANEDRLLDDFIPQPRPAGAQREPKPGKIVF